MNFVWLHRTPKRVYFETAETIRVEGDNIVYRRSHDQMAGAVVNALVSTGRKMDPAERTNLKTLYLRACEEEPWIVEQTKWIDAQGKRPALIGVLDYQGK